MAFMTEAAERAFHDAIEAIEKVSAVEVVVAVRPRLRRTWIAHAVAGALATAAALAYVLYSDFEFDEWSILAVPLLAGVAGALLVEAVPAIERAVVRDAAVLEAARAAFVELGVHSTRGRTGVLAFVAVRERRVVLVGDVAVIERLGEPGLARRAGVLAELLPSGGVGVAEALGKLATDFAAVLPRAADDVNELADMVQTRAPLHKRLRGKAAS